MAIYQCATETHGLWEEDSCKHQPKHENVHSLILNSDKWMKSIACAVWYLVSKGNKGKMLVSWIISYSCHNVYSSVYYIIYIKAYNVEFQDEKWHNSSWQPKLVSSSLSNSVTRCTIVHTKLFTKPQAFVNFSANYSQEPLLCEGLIVCKLASLLTDTLSGNIRLQSSVNKECLPKWQSSCFWASERCW